MDLPPAGIRMHEKREDEESLTLLHVFNFTTRRHSVDYKICLSAYCYSCYAQSKQLRVLLIAPLQVRTNSSCNSFRGPGTCKAYNIGALVAMLGTRSLMPRRQPLRSGSSMCNLQARSLLAGTRRAAYAAVLRASSQQVTRRRRNTQVPDLAEEVGGLLRDATVAAQRRHAFVLTTVWFGIISDITYICSAGT